MNRLATFLLMGALGAGQPLVGQMSVGEPPAGMPAVAGPLAAKYRMDADRILKAAMADHISLGAVTRKAAAAEARYFPAKEGVL